MKMNISLKLEHERFIEEQLNTGRYSTVDQVIAEALRLLEEQDKINQKRLEELRRKIASGTEQIAQGKVTDGEVVFARMEAKIRSFFEFVE
jgi:antitoxin ParD1/3/4